MEGLLAEALHLRGEEGRVLVIYRDGCAVAGELTQLGEDLLADGIRQDGVTEGGGSFLGSRVGLRPHQEINDLLGLDTVGHRGCVQDDVGVTGDRPGTITLAIHDGGS